MGVIRGLGPEAGGGGVVRGWWHEVIAERVGWHVVAGGLGPEAGGGGGGGGGVVRGVVA